MKLSLALLALALTSYQDDPEDSYGAMERRRRRVVRWLIALAVISIGFAACWVWDWIGRL